MTTELTKAAQRLDDFLSQFDENEQERILRYALDHVVPRLNIDAERSRDLACLRIVDQHLRRAVSATCGEYRDSVRELIPHC